MTPSSKAEPAFPYALVPTATFMKFPFPTTTKAKQVLDCDELAVGAFDRKYKSVFVVTAAQTDTVNDDRDVADVVPTFGYGYVTEYGGNEAFVIVELRIRAGIVLILPLFAENFDGEGEGDLDLVAALEGLGVRV
jgi:hypothetical protein